MKTLPCLFATIVMSLGLSALGVAQSATPTATAPTATAQVQAAADLERALAQLKTTFPAAPSVSIPPLQAGRVSSVNKYRLIDPQNNPQMRDIYTRYQREATIMKGETLALNIKAMRADLARDLPLQQTLMNSSNPASDSTRDQYFATRASIEWLRQQVTPWLDQVQALLPPPPAKN